MLFTLEALRSTLREDLNTTLDQIRVAEGVEAAILAHGQLMGRLIELERLGVLQLGQRQAWLVDAAAVFRQRRQELAVLDDSPEQRVAQIELAGVLASSRGSRHE
jgi:hypothetical protein